MKKQLAGLLAASLLLSGTFAIPTVSAASSAGNNSIKTNWLNNGPDRNGYNNNNRYGNGGGYTGGNASNEGTVSGSAGSTGSASVQASGEIEKIIAEGMTYKGTPYEFGSNRDTDTTFDCSDFVRWIFKRIAGVTLPSDSRQQGDFVKDRSAVHTDWRQLKRGDLMFFMTFEGPDASDYRNVNKKTERITHVGIYLGNGKILHTFSKDSGGVRVDSFEGTSWEYRFLFGGSAL